MREKLNCILMIDDDAATNYLHRIVIEATDYYEKLVFKTNGYEALKFLSTPIDGEYPRPELIFLDINMPKIDGWEFLEAYKNLPIEQRGEVIILMLSTSLNPHDEKRAQKIEEISGFKDKPLTEEILTELISEYFYEKV